MSELKLENPIYKYSVKPVENGFMIRFDDFAFEWFVPYVRALETMREVEKMVIHNLLKRKSKRKSK